MKLKKEFTSFYQEIRIDSESHVLKEKRERFLKEMVLGIS